MSFEELKSLTEYSKFQEYVKKINVEIKTEQMADTVLICQKSKSWICGRKHKIVNFRNGFKRINSQPVAA